MQVLICISPTTHRRLSNGERFTTNLLFAGHYATETVGIKALAAHLEQKYNVKTEFIDIPTGL